MKRMKVTKAKRFGIYSCYAADTLKTAARMMNARNVSALVVVDEEGYLDGVITRTDLVRACLETDAWADALVEEYMTHDAVTVTVDESMLTVMELLIDRHIHRVVVVDKESGGLRPVAVLSATDVVYHMAQD